MKPSGLFFRCAYLIPYVQVGNSVNYAFEEVDDSLFIYFQGSNSISDWVRNFLFKKRPYKDMKIPYRYPLHTLSRYLSDVLLRTPRQGSVLLYRGGNVCSAYLPPKCTH